jgi:hypothetical protein
MELGIGSRVAIVGGGSRGCGREGARVVLTGRDDAGSCASCNDLVH